MFAFPMSNLFCSDLNAHNALTYAFPIETATLNGFQLNNEVKRLEVKKDFKVAKVS